MAYLVFHFSANAWLIFFLLIWITDKYIFPTFINIETLFSIVMIEVL